MLWFSFLPVCVSNLSAECVDFPVHHRELHPQSAAFICLCHLCSRSLLLPFCLHMALCVLTIFSYCTISVREWMVSHLWIIIIIMIKTYWVCIYMIVNFIIHLPHSTCLPGRILVTPFQRHLNCTVLSPNLYTSWTNCLTASSLARVFAPVCHMSNLKHCRWMYQ